MNFVTAAFLSFFIPVLCFGWILRGVGDRVYKWFLVVAGLYFYSQAGTICVPCLLFVALVNWGCVRMMKGRRRVVRLAWASACIAVEVLLLVFFKYYISGVEWAMEEFGDAAGWLLNPRLAELVMPIGLSFYCFQGISYTVDHYRDSAAEPRGYADVLCFLSFFPTVMSGPIMREGDFFPQLRTSFAGDDDFAEGGTLILSGLFKKVVLATYLQLHLVDGVFAAPGNYSSAAVAMAIYAYAAQIYCDFSGYTDIATGVARLMGFRLPRNFDAPYRACSLQEFWHRWHISLSTWLRDYLYIPLGGSRRGNRYLNLIITMLIGGAWHGCGLSFIVWGGLHGLGLAAVHAYKRLTRGVVLHHACLRSAARVAGWFLTLHAVVVLWVFFRAETPWDALTILRRVGEGAVVGEGFPLSVVIATLTGLGLSFCGGWLYRVATTCMRVLPWPAQAVVVGLLVGFILNMGPEGTLPFIYFRF